MKTAHFEPDTLIEIDDTLGGFRKLAIVTGSGDGYIDLIDEDAPAFPTYEALSPVAIGNSLSWGLELIDQDAEQAREFIALQRHLMAAGIDSLTYNRALFWAYQTRALGFAEALRAGREATDRVQQSRLQMDRLIRRGRAAHLRLV
ncbi:hypothetical protein [Aquitalea pelogenes]|uniref:hypothetical protein n=1 Tax=Aquitalea pelogenes TaxID=1293573 RepID=UPI0007898A23|nr:hypothetical protein [Aquitalea pelogenes]